MIELLPVTIEIGIGLVVIPWCVWVSASIFNSQKSIALLRQELSQNREIYELLKDKLS